LIGRCGIDDVRTIVAPDARHKVIVFRKNCGATNAYSTQAVLLPRWRPFVVTLSYPFFISDETKQLAVRWRGNEALVINVSSGVETFRREPAVDGISITYHVGGR